MVSRPADVSMVPAAVSDALSTAHEKVKAALRDGGPSDPNVLSVARAGASAVEDARKRQKGYRPDYRAAQDELLRACYDKQLGISAAYSVHGDEVDGLLEEHLAEYRQYLSLDRYCVRRLSEKVGSRR